MLFFERTKGRPAQKGRAALFSHYKRGLDAHAEGFHHSGGDLLAFLVHFAVLQGTVGLAEGEAAGDVALFAALGLVHVDKLGAFEQGGLHALHSGEDGIHMQALGSDEGDVAAYGGEGGQLLEVGVLALRSFAEQVEVEVLPPQEELLPLALALPVPVPLQLAQTQQVPQLLPLNTCLPTHQARLSIGYLTHTHTTRIRVGLQKDFRSEKPFFENF